MAQDFQGNVLTFAIKHIKLENEGWKHDRNAYN